MGNDRAEDYVNIPPLVGPEGHQIWGRENVVEVQPRGSITVACEYPEAAIRLLDMMYEPELSVEVNWGALGEVYEKNDNGVMVWTTFPSAILNEYYSTVVEYPQDGASEDAQNCTECI